MKLLTLVRSNVGMLECLVAVVIILYIEVYSYRHSALDWPHFLDVVDGDMELETKMKMDTFRVLVVADPQLQGYVDEPAILGYVTRADCDRYLRRTFSMVASSVKPNLVVYLGDLFDEGSTATDVDFRATLRRFRSIYPPDASESAYIYGDNDVGGEGFERVSKDAIRRFEEHFSSIFNVQSSRLARKHDMFLQHIDLFQKSIRALSPNMSTTNRLTIGLSHMSLTRGRPTARRLLNESHSSVLLTAHDHRARVYHRRDNTSRDTVDILTRERSTMPIIRLSLTEGARVEFQTPTCSYRMGTVDMGFGVLQLSTASNADGNDEVFAEYAVIWLPKRLSQLTFYLLAVILLVLSSILRLKLCSRSNARKVSIF